ARLAAMSPTPNTRILRKNFFAAFAARKNLRHHLGAQQARPRLDAQPRSVEPTLTLCSAAKFATLVLASAPSWALRATTKTAAFPSVSPDAAQKNSSSAMPNSSKPKKRYPHCPFCHPDPQAAAFRSLRRRDLSSASEFASKWRNQID